MTKIDSTQLGLEYMLAELEGNQLVTVLVPQKRRTNEGGMIRVNLSINPKWYRDLCARHPSSRGTRRGKHDTILRRIDIVRILARLSQGKKSSSIYADELRQIASKLKIHAA